MSIVKTERERETEMRITVGNVTRVMLSLKMDKTSTIGNWSITRVESGWDVKRIDGSEFRHGGRMVNEVTAHMSFARDCIMRNSK